MLHQEISTAASQQIIKFPVHLHCIGRHCIFDLVFLSGAAGKFIDPQFLVEDAIGSLDDILPDMAFVLCVLHSDVFGKDSILRR